MSPSIHLVRWKIHIVMIPLGFLQWTGHLINESKEHLNRVRLQIPFSEKLNPH